MPESVACGSRKVAGEREREMEMLRWYSRYPGWAGLAGWLAVFTVKSLTFLGAGDKALFLDFGLGKGKGEMGEFWP